MRIPPLPGEAWPGYLDRVAAHYGVTPPALVSPISRRWAERLTRPLNRWTSGLAITLDTAAAVAQLFNLHTDEVTAMHMQADAGTTLTVTQADLDAFDPVSGDATPSRSESLGWVIDRGEPRWCPTCRERRPDLQLRIFRYPWLVFCPTHHDTLQPLPTAGHEP
nr:TniQ family protein [Arsenicicoccus dermatophilus]